MMIPNRELKSWRQFLLIGLAIGYLISIAMLSVTIPRMKLMKLCHGPMKVVANGP